MKMTFIEYAARHPYTEPAEPDEEALKYHEDVEITKTIDNMKADLLEQLKQGTEPQHILFQAVRIIGSATQDPDWSSKAIEILETTYEDLAQKSLLLEEQSEVLKRLQDMKSEYLAKTKKDLSRAIKRTERIQWQLRESLNKLDQMNEEPNEQGQTEGIL